MLNSVIPRSPKKPEPKKEKKRSVNKRFVKKNQNQETFRSKLPSKCSFSPSPSPFVFSFPLKKQKKKKKNFNKCKTKKNENSFNSFTLLPSTQSPVREFVPAFLQ